MIAADSSPTAVNCGEEAGVFSIPIGHLGPAIDHLGINPWDTLSLPSGCSAKCLLMVSGGSIFCPLLTVSTEAD